jgi:RNA polymerase sigma factor (sigma-70 family)
VQQREAAVDQRRLVERARGGDHDAFAELARAAVVRLDEAARLILRDPELARDAVQDALIRAWKDLPKLRDADRFDAWLRRLTVNACFDQARRRRRRVIEVELMPMHAPATSDSTAAHADREQVDQVLRGLDDHGRAIVVLHYYLGLSLTDVAATLGVPIGTVKSRLHRALGEMRVAIEPGPTIAAAPYSGGQPA